MFTGKAKELFEEWYKKQYPNNSERVVTSPFYFRYYCPISMQFGIYLDFADSLNLSISLNLSWDLWSKKKEGYFIEIKDTTDYDKEHLYCGEFTTRNEAIPKAIEKLNEIINNEF